MMRKIKIYFFLFFVLIFARATSKSSLSYSAYKPEVQINSGGIVRPSGGVKAFLLRQKEDRKMKTVAYNYSVDEKRKTFSALG